MSSVVNGNVGNWGKGNAGINVANMSNTVVLADLRVRSRVSEFRRPASVVENKGVERRQSISCPVSDHTLRGLLVPGTNQLNYRGPYSFRSRWSFPIGWTDPVDPGRRYPSRSLLPGETFRVCIQQDGTQNHQNPLGCMPEGLASVSVAVPSGHPGQGDLVFPCLSAGRGLSNQLNDAPIYTVPEHINSMRTFLVEINMVGQNPNGEIVLIAQWGDNGFERRAFPVPIQNASTPAPTPQTSTSQTSTSQVSTPQTSTSRVSTPQTSTSQVSTPQTSTSRVSTPHVFMSQAPSVSRAPVPQASATQRLNPETTISPRSTSRGMSSRKWTDKDTKILVLGILCCGVGVLVAVILYFSQKRPGLMSRMGRKCLKALASPFKWMQSKMKRDVATPTSSYENPVYSEIVLPVQGQDQKARGGVKVNDTYSNGEPVYEEIGPNPPGGGCIEEAYV